MEATDRRVLERREVLVSFDRALPPVYDYPACMGAIATEAYTALDPVTVSDRTPLAPVPPRTLAPIGDEMAVVALDGSFVLGGITHADQGLIPFVRVGRAVTWMNPNSAETVSGQPGYDDAMLEQALATTAEQLRIAQGL